MGHGINVKIEIKNLERIKRIFERLSRAIGGRGNGGSRADLHLRFAIIAINWITRNFREEGALSGTPWKKLSLNTLANRRTGAGRILQDTGLLRASFNVPKWNENEAKVGSPLEIAKYHEYGTKGPYPIEAKNAKVLRFKRATQVAVVTKRLASGRSITLPKASGGYVFYKRVMHPGLAARPMLPEEKDILPDMMRAVLNYIRQAQNGSTEGNGANV